jgi:Chalcone isomerase-like
VAAVRALAAALALALALPSAAREVSGVKLPEALTVEGRALVLNGAGLRRQFIFDVYVCGLYLERPAHDRRQILAEGASWAIVLHFLRDVDHEKILQSFRHAFERNSPGLAERLEPGLVKFHDEVMSTLVVKRGQRLTLAYAPEVGSTLTVPDGRSSTVTGQEFGDALLRTWIGERPADRRLEDELLGLP